MEVRAAVDGKQLDKGSGKTREDHFLDKENNQTAEGTKDDEMKEEEGTVSNCE